MSRVTVVQQKRDEVSREAYIPESVTNAMTTSEGGRVTEKQLMINGGAGVYSCDYHKYYLFGRG